MVEDLTDDALDVIIDIVMDVQKRLPKRPGRTKAYWMNITEDWWCEWRDRRTYGHRDGGEDNVTLKA